MKVFRLDVGIKVEARSCRQLTTVNLERQEIINSGVTTMDMTVVAQELVNRGVTTMDMTVMEQETSKRGKT
jgi:hypothetical protein